MSTKCPDPAAWADVGQRYQSLLEVTDLTGLHAHVDDFLPDLAACLSNVESFDAIFLVLAWEGIESATLYRVRRPPDDGESARFGLESDPLPPPLRTPAAALWGRQSPIVLHMVAEGGDYDAVVEYLRDSGAESACLLPLVTAVHPLGFLGFASSRPGAYDESDLVFLQLVAGQVATALDNVRHYEDAVERQHRLEAERDRWHVLLDINNALVTNLDLASLLAAITPSLRDIVPHDSTSLVLLRDEGERVGPLALDPDFPAWLEQVMSSVKPGETPLALALSIRRPLDLDPDKPGSIPESLLKPVMSLDIKRVCLVPLYTARRPLGCLLLGRSVPEPFTDEQVSRLADAAGQIAIALENALAFGEIAHLKDRLAQENRYLEDEIRGSRHFEEIIGESGALQRVLAQARSVAGTDSTVLLLGETGTGKELFARAIHSMSARRSRTLVTVNCATSPAGLLESEWFGHEKGAFTGALARKVGRFELAHQGTLFLDEIGDVPLDLQAKLLRVLQEHEIERLGSTGTIHVDFRLVAATNRDLETMVARREYRSDLYYRLSVFPIRIPPLRERRDDIPPLVRYFVQRYARRLRRNIETVAPDTMDALVRWDWPGNVRELQNVIERAVILSDGPALHVSRSGFEQPGVAASQSPVTLEDAERAHILHALEETGWVIGGPRGAAHRLAVNRTTLSSRMQRLGIVRPKPAALR